MFKNIMTLGSLTILCFTLCHGSTEHWHSMQKHYHELVRNLSSRKSHLTDNDLCHPYWQKTRLNIQTLVQGSYNPNFLNTPEIKGTMVRGGMTVGQVYELCFLKDCTSSSTRSKLQKFRDTQFGNLPIECTDLQCSVSTLGHLFYAARTMELMEKDPESIVELGGGYGNLARIYTHCFPQCTYFIIDLPELLALQYFFLKETNPEKKVIFHTQPAESYQSNAIHLIPINYVKDLNVVSDLFVSTFALSEASEITQKIIRDKKFFHASTVYITGQLSGWGAGMNFVHHSKIHDSLHDLYAYVDIHPFHLILGNLKSYEAIAKNLNI